MNHQRPWVPHPWLSQAVRGSRAGLAVCAGYGVGRAESDLSHSPTPAPGAGGSKPQALRVRGAMWIVAQRRGSMLGGRES